MSPCHQDEVAGSLGSKAGNLESFYSVEALEDIVGFAAPSDIH